MRAHRAMDTGYGLGFAWLALGLAMVPLAIWAPRSGVIAAALAAAGLVLLAWARARWSKAEASPPGHAPVRPWSRDRAVGFLAGTAVFWSVFALAAMGGAATEAAPAESPPVPAALEDTGQVGHTFRIDPSRYVAMGAPSTSVGPAWTIPASTLRVDGVASWDASSGLRRLHVSLEEETPNGWMELGRWVVAPDGTFNATIDAQPGRVRLTAAPDVSNPGFRPVDVAATVTFLARSA